MCIRSVCILNNNYQAYQPGSKLPIIFLDLKNMLL